MQIALFQLRALLPGLPIQPARSMCDRAGLLAPHSLDNSINRPAPGCSNGGDRTSDWLHVNSFGQTYLCCCDYAEVSIVGDLRTESIHEAVQRDKSAAVAEIKQRLCAHCTFAKG